MKVTFNITNIDWRYKSELEGLYPNVTFIPIFTLEGLVKEFGMDTTHRRTISEVVLAALELIRTDDYILDALERLDTQDIQAEAGRTLESLKQEFKDQSRSNPEKFQNFEDCAQLVFQISQIPLTFSLLNQVNYHNLNIPQSPSQFIGQLFGGYDLTADNPLESERKPFDCANWIYFVPTREGYTVLRNKNCPHMMFSLLKEKETQRPEVTRTTTTSAVLYSQSSPQEVTTKATTSAVSEPRKKRKSLRGPPEAMTPHVQEIKPTSSLVIILDD